MSSKDIGHPEVQIAPVLHTVPDPAIFKFSEYKNKVAVKNKRVLL
jgi:hypothetical protein